MLRQLAMKENICVGQVGGVLLSVLLGSVGSATSILPHFPLIDVFNSLSYSVALAAEGEAAPSASSLRTAGPAALRAQWGTFPACSHIAGGVGVFAFHFDHSTNKLTHK